MTAMLANAVHDHVPVLPLATHWAVVLVMLGAGLFLAAAVIGPIVRLHEPHDEPPSTSH